MTWAFCLLKAHLKKTLRIKINILNSAGANGQYLKALTGLCTSSYRYVQWAVTHSFADIVYLY